MKKDGKKEQFDRAKLKTGILKACEKTVVGIDEIDKITDEVERELRGFDSVEVESKRIGMMVAGRLKKIDKIAYIRFASVFRRFLDVEDFEKELHKLL
jgi:transcriptional repressor NrdR